MTFRRAALAVTALAAAAGLCACTSAAAGHGSTAPSAVPSSTTRVVTPAASEAPATGTPSTATSSTEPSEDPSTPSSAPSDGSSASAGTPLRCSGTPRQLVDCLSASLRDYWRSHLPEVADVDQPVVLDLPAVAGDRCDEHAAEADTPFTCTTDGRLFLPPAFRRSLAGWFGAADLPYAYASILSHEYGHFLQLQVDDKTLGSANPTQAQSRSVEQQADCLSGVWAHHAATDHRYDAGRFDATAMELIRRVSSNPEVYTHGTPDDRSAAIDRGLGTGKPSSCGLAGLR